MTTLSFLDVAGLSAWHRLLANDTHAAMRALTRAAEQRGNRIYFHMDGV